MCKALNMQKILQNNIPWIEKYRPKKFEEIVLDPINRTIFKNIVKKNYFPNLLFYGPPGTGKSQTITNLLASCIAVNKKVLFVAEKQTALNAVKDRLDACGLGKYTLNLHAKGDSDNKLRTYRLRFQ
jgi:replication-associated recombination protein RarA